MLRPDEAKLTDPIRPVCYHSARLRENHG
jgi:hypothetical protein